MDWKFWQKKEQPEPQKSWGETFTIGGVRVTATEGRVLQDVANGFKLALEGNPDDFDTVRRLLKAHLLNAGYTVEVKTHDGNHKNLLEVFSIGVFYSPMKGASREQLAAELAHLQRSVPDRTALTAEAARLETAVNTQHETRTAAARARAKARSDLNGPGNGQGR